MAQNLKDIKALVFDIDGVLTDGSIIPLWNGDLLRIFNAKDAMAMRIAALRGMVTAVMSGGNTEALRSRCLHIGIKEENLFLGCRGKYPIFMKFCEDRGIKPEEVAYFGDDIADVPVLKACGFAVVPSDASEEALEVADFVSTYPGGKGAVRQAVVMILKAQDKWYFDDYTKYF